MRLRESDGEQEIPAYKECSTLLDTPKGRGDKSMSRPRIDIGQKWNRLICFFFGHVFFTTATGFIDNDPVYRAWAVFTCTYCPEKRNMIYEKILVGRTKS